MENLNPKDLLNLWKKGKTLYSGMYAFTAYELQKKCTDLELKLNNKSRNPWENNTSEKPNIATGLSAVSETIFLQGKIDSARDELKWDLLENILSEKVIGLGYEAPVTTESKPKIIPLHIWPRTIKEINWDNSSILKHGITFSDIRLIKKSAFKKKTDNKKSISAPKTPIKDKKTGRPSLKEKIIEAYEFLKKEGSIDYSKTLKSHTEIIQKTVQTLNPEITDTAGMAHEAIRRAISKQFQADKTTSKPASKL